MTRQTRNNIIKTIRTLTLLAGMSVGGGMAWGKTGTESQKIILNTHPASTDSVVLYVQPDVPEEVVFQSECNQTLDGYIVIHGEEGDDTWSSSVTFGNAQRYQNGLYWSNSSISSNIPGNQCKFTIAVSSFSPNEEKKIIMDLSSVFSYGDLNLEALGGLSLRRTYFIRNAEERADTLKAKKDVLDKNDTWKKWNSDASAQLPIGDPSSFFMENFEIHTPIKNMSATDLSGTNFRLNDKIYNIYVYDNAGIVKPADRVRWRVYDETRRNVTKAGGTYWGTFGSSQMDKGDNYYILKRQEQNTGKFAEFASIFSYRFKEQYEANVDIKRSYKYYITAEVGYEEGGKTIWYPYAFRTVYLEPHQEPLTQSGINEKVKSDPSNYQIRNRTYLEENYDLVAYEAFDTEITDLQTGERKSLLIPKDELTTKTNYKEGSLPRLTPTYAFAYPSYREEDRKDDRGRLRKKSFSVGRGEYALYRTLNVAGVSTNSQGYGDWFASNDGKYNVNVYDRYHDISGGKKLGYFFYLDAADEAGKITDLSFSDDLCPNTRIFVTAWVCNLRHNSGGTPPPANADIGFTFRGRNKGKDGQIKDNDLLYKYYTGTIPQSTSTENGEKRADWQQVSFSFTVSDVEYDEYVLEILNNCVHSNAADYAIDDIRIYRSRPEAQVERCDHCEADTIKISLPYISMLDDMGWEEDQPISLDHVKDSIKLFMRYRLGLHGPDPESTFGRADGDISSEDNYTGNIYLGVIDGLNPDDPKQKDVTYNDNAVAGEAGYKWIDINKKIDNPILSKVIRCIISSNLNGVSSNYPDDGKYPRTREASDRIDTLFNYRALKDYNYIVTKKTDRIQDFLPDNLPGSTVPIEHKEINLEGLGITEREVGEKIVEDISDVNPAVYDSLVHVLFAERLGIPPVHCGYYDPKGYIYLQNILVSNTDMKYKGEILLGENGMPTKTYAGDFVRASGKYHALLYTATEIAQGKTNPQDRCTMKNEFTVQRSLDVYVNPETDYNSLLCNGQIRTIDVELNPNILDVPTDSLKKEEYDFDCFIGSRADYDRITIDEKDLLEIIKAFRDENKSYGPLTIQDIDEASSGSDEVKSLLKQLIKQEKLQTGSKQFTIIMQKQIVLMPYINDKRAQNVPDAEIFCLKPTDLDFENLDDIPSLAPGFPTVNYPELVPAAPVRLGLRHLDEQVLTIPLRKEVVSGWNKKFAEDDPNYHADFVLKKDKKRGKISVLSNSVLTEVGEVVRLQAQSGKSENTLVMKLKQGENGFTFEEGREYTLYIPFAEYADEDATEPIQGSCDGLGLLPVKIVPEYLTWKGDDDDVWYNDGKWHQSTKGELYVGDKAYTDNEDAGKDDDANGSDNVENAFTPLYFTKITIPGGKTLELENSTYESDSLVGLKEGKTPYIQYDMAIDTITDAAGTDEYKVKPYYINKVNEIYFKPKARLRRQQYLTYDTARVEFEMAKNGKYWLSSPLQEVFAGDMYAPKSTGRQTTFAFDPIFYAAGAPDSGNDRQNPAFYQKAWDKGVTVYTPKEGKDGILSESDLTGNDYQVVRSNWSVEYNDVNVPYALGKGFYASVEDFENDNALVRLPKADKGYRYEPQTTKAASTIGTRKDSVGRLAGSEPVEVVLSDADTEKVWWQGDKAIADGDGKHFLLGNPYMYPLDIDKFLDENKDVLNQKYWTLSNTGGTTSVVGTPDVEWNGGEVNSATEIAPMQAFFVELKETTGSTARSQEGDPVVVFKPEMMSGETDAAGKSSLRSVVTATHPVIRLTATNGDKRSIAYLTQRDDASDAYESDKDAVTLLDSELTEISQVYTIAGSRTVGVNAVKRIDNIPLGVYAASGKEDVSLTIEGFGSLPGTLYLYDAQSRTSKPLAGDSHTLLLDGSSHGRYFLRSSENPTGNETVFAPAISIYSAVAGKVVVSATEPLKQVQVFTPAGTLVRNLLPGQQVCTLSLPQGIYFVRALTTGTEKAEKLRVR